MVLSPSASLRAWSPLCFSCRGDICLPEAGTLSVPPDGAPAGGPPHPGGSHPCSPRTPAPGPGEGAEVPGDEGRPCVGSTAGEGGGCLARSRLSQGTNLWNLLVTCVDTGLVCHLQILCQRVRPAALGGSRASGPGRGPPCRSVQVLTRGLRDPRRPHPSDSGSAAQRKRRSNPAGRVAEDLPGPQWERLQRVSEGHAGH